MLCFTQRRVTMISRKARVMIGLAGLLLLALPASAQRYRRYYADEYHDAGEFRLDSGSFRPDGRSHYWRSNRHAFSNSDPSAVEAVSFGIAYLLPVHDQQSVIFSGGWYEGTTTNA